MNTAGGLYGLPLNKRGARRQMILSYATGDSIPAQHGTFARASSAYELSSQTLTQVSYSPGASATEARSSSAYFLLDTTTLV